MPVAKIVACPQFIRPFTFCWFLTPSQANLRDSSFHFIFLGAVFSMRLFTTLSIQTRHWFCCQKHWWKRSRIFHHKLLEKLIYFFSCNTRTDHNHCLKPMVGHREQLISGCQYDGSVFSTCICHMMQMAVALSQKRQMTHGELFCWRLWTQDTPVNTFWVSKLELELWRLWQLRAI